MKTANIHTTMVVLEDEKHDKWFWEVSTFQIGDDCYGTATERNKKINLPWIKVENLDLTHTIVDVCKDLMRKIAEEERA